MGNSLASIFDSIINVVKEAAQDDINNMSPQEYMLKPQIHSFYTKLNVVKEVK